jgi:broad specificity phosphatase PhoE
MLSDSTDSSTNGAVRTRKRIIAVMRHGPRLDGVDDIALANPHYASCWPDKEHRPHDTPIADDATVIESAHKLASHGIDIIIASPFRRTLQTATIVAQILGIREISADNRLHEIHAEAARYFRKLSPPIIEFDDRFFPSMEVAKDIVSTAYVSGAGAECLEVSLSWKDPSAAIHKGSADDRVAHIQSLLDEFPVDKNILLVTHGDLVNVLGPRLDYMPDVGKYIYETSGFFVATSLDTESHLRVPFSDTHIVERDRSSEFGV